MSEREKVLFKDVWLGGTFLHNGHYFKKIDHCMAMSDHSFEYAFTPNTEVWIEKAGE